MALRNTRQHTAVLAEGDGDARITRQVVAVLAAGTGTARITRQVVEVLAEVAAGGGTIYDLEVGHTLAINQAGNSAGGSEFNRDVSHTIALQQAVGQAYDVSVETVIALSQDAHNGIIYDLEVETTLAIVQTAQRTLELQEVESTIALVQNVDIPNVTELAIAQTVSAELIKLVESEMEMTHTVVVNVDYSRSVSHTLNIQQSVIGYILRDDTDCTYSPFGDLPSEPVVTTGTLTLTWPYAAPTTTLVLRNPDFGNQHMLTFSRINRTTRGGTLIVFSDPDWPKFETIAIRVQGLTENQAKDLLEFFYDSTAAEVGLLDWEGRQWRGLITNPEAQIQQARKGCGYEVEIEFEGRLA